MKSNKFMWSVTGITAMLSTLLFLFGFAYAIRDVVSPRPSDLGAGLPANPQVSAGPARDKYQILAIGDSLTKGLGDTTGKGYVGRVKDGLQNSTQKPVTVWNLANNGWHTNELLQYIEDPANRMTDSIKQANVILFTIGGNDLFDAGVIQPSDSEKGQSPRIDEAKLKAALPGAEDRLDKIITKLAALNPDAQIVYINFYHPFLDYDQPARIGARYVQAWNDKAFEIANRFPNVTVVPTYDMFQANLGKYLFTDHFHPNNDGYQRIADRVLQALQ
jgi:lysophospholipase L1-like esterase